MWPEYKNFQTAKTRLYIVLWVRHILSYFSLN